MDSFFGPSFPFLFFRESKTVTREFNCRLVDDRVECNAIKLSNADGRRQSMSPEMHFLLLAALQGASIYDFRTRVGDRHGEKGQVLFWLFARQTALGIDNYPTS